MQAIELTTGRVCVGDRFVGHPLTSSCYGNEHRDERRHRDRADPAQKERPARGVGQHPPDRRAGDHHHHGGWFEEIARGTRPAMQGKADLDRHPQACRQAKPQGLEIPPRHGDG